MQSWFLLGPSSSDGAGALFLPSRTPFPLLGLRRCPDCRSRRRPAPAAAIGGGEQDHYAVLGLARSASAADVKRSYRLLARKYHPDVSKELQADVVFKSIRLAYEVLSDEVTRAKYDMRLRLTGTVDDPWRVRWTENAESDGRRRARRWAAKVRQRILYEQDEEDASWYDPRDVYHANSGNERGSFSDLMRFSLLTLLFMKLVGYRITLALCTAAACFDVHLDAGYKMSYLIACFLGGHGGILLALCIYFASWLCGKNSSSLVAVVLVAMWAATSLARFIPLPQGAVLALLYMSIKLQVDLK